MAKKITTEALRRAEANLANVKTMAPQEQHRAFQNAKVVPISGHYHPLDDRAETQVLEAQLELSAAQSAWASEEPEAAQLCDSLRAALTKTRDALAKNQDDPEPTLASIPEAAEEFKANAEAHGSECRANAGLRADITEAALKRIAKAKDLSAARALLDKADGEISAIVDPEPRELGFPSPTLVAALTVHLTNHRDQVARNANARQAAREDLIIVLISINEALKSLKKRREASRLPGPGSLFASSFEPAPISLDRLANDAGFSRLTPELCESYLGCIGHREIDCTQIRRRLAEIRGRAKAYEARKDIEPEAGESAFATLGKRIRGFRVTMAEQRRAAPLPDGSGIERHVGIVHHVIRQRGYARRFAGKGGVDVEDIMQAGLAGLFRAAQTYDSKRGSFSTYAHHWVRSKIERLVADTHSTVRSPVHRQLDAARKGECRFASVARLDVPIGKDEESITRLDLLEDDAGAERAQREEDQIHAKTVLAELYATAGLSDREALVLRLRARDWPLAKIGKKLGVTRERIRQIHVGALAKLQHAALRLGHHVPEDALIAERRKVTAA